MKNPTKPATQPPATPKPTDAQKLAKIRAAKSKLKKADAAHKKTATAYSKAQQELATALAAL